MWTEAGINQMLPKLKQYLARVKSNSRLDPKAESEVVRELQTHFEDEIGELCQTGFSAAEAADEATKRFGAPDALGRQMYEVYSQGTWNQALLAAVPHFLLALTFGFRLWRNDFWLLTAALVAIGVTVYAWRHGRPSWFYSWLGYFLIPLFVVILLVLLAVGQGLSWFVLGNGMQWVMMAVYVPVALCLLGYIIVRVVRRDWLLASFMLLPFPAIVVWLFALEQSVGLVGYGKGGFESGSQGIAFTFLALGGTAGVFIRLRQRLLKIGVLAVATFLILGIAWRFAESDLNPVICLLVSVCFVSFLLSPWLLQNRVVHRGGETEAWDEACLEQAVRKT
jgi:hypothetical protein